MSTTQHFVVRSVLLSENGGAALTLEPVSWWREDPDNLVDDSEGNMVPDLVLADDDPCTASEVSKIGGKMTELRFEVDPGQRPGDYVTVTVAPTDTPRTFSRFG